MLSAISLLLIIIDLPAPADCQCATAAAGEDRIEDGKAVVAIVWRLLGRMRQELTLELCQEADARGGASASDRVRTLWRPSTT